ncbi:hypothetical protein BB561_001912 [Smittium simulii]|uniref:PIPK domain-containing protein n=1 Tax=Smittium simulii TaxID=133385 RepID=A0A2T9YSI9_9FUNG|nr:hypothetical protein BB561_001912 [Smittium simulii]
MEIGFSASGLKTFRAWKSRVAPELFIRIMESLLNPEISMNTKAKPITPSNSSNSDSSFEHISNKTNPYSTFTKSHNLIGSEGWERDTIVEKLSSEALQATSAEYLSEQSVIYSKKNKTSSWLLSRKFSRSVDISTSIPREIEPPLYQIQSSDDLKNIDLSKSIDILSTDLSHSKTISRKSKAIHLSKNKVKIKHSTFYRPISLANNSTILVSKPINSPVTQKNIIDNRNLSPLLPNNNSLSFKQFPLAKPSKKSRKSTKPKVFVKSSITTNKVKQSSLAYLIPPNPLIDINNTSSKKSPGNTILLKKKGLTRMKSDFVTIKDSPRVLNKPRYSSSSTLNQKLLHDSNNHFVDLDQFIDLSKASNSAQLAEINPLPPFNRVSPLIDFLPSNRPSISHNRPLSSSDRPSISHNSSSPPSNRPSISHNSSSPPSNRSSISHKSSSPPSNHPSISDNRPLSSSDRPSISHNSSSPPSNRPSISHNSSSPPSNRSSISHKSSSPPSNHPSISDNRPLSSSDRSSISHKSSSPPSNRPSISFKKTSQTINSNTMPDALVSFQPSLETSKDEYRISSRTHSSYNRSSKNFNKETSFDNLELNQDISPATLDTSNFNEQEEHINFKDAKEIENLLSSNLEKKLSIQIDSEIHSHVSLSPKNLEPSEKKLDSQLLKRTTITQPSNNSDIYGVTIDKNHINYVLMYNMLTGIRVSVSRCIAKSKRNIEPRDYKAAHKYSFDVVGDEQVPKRGCYDFKFKDYAPVAFHHIRCTFNLSATEYLVALTDRYILSEVGSSGKSGSFFYYSQDLRFIIKTISKTEHKFMRVFLKDYCEHIRNNPGTLLSRIYGLHRIKQPNGKKIHFIVMNNLFPPSRIIHEQYDLKGSFQGRRANKPKTDKNSLVCLKDLDWLDMQKKLNLGPDTFHQFALQLASDVGLLMQVNIMDYSLLVGVHDVGRGNSFDKTDIGILKRQTLSLFDPTNTQLPQQKTPMSKVNTIRSKVVRTDPVAIAIPQIPLKRTGTNKNKHTSNLNPRNSLLDPDVHSKEKKNLTILNKESKITISENILKTKANIAIKLENTSIDLNEDMSCNEDEDFDFTNRSISDISTEEDGLTAADESDNPMGYVYYMGIIDILTPYNKRKRAEHLLKAVWYKNTESMSVVNPKKYADRFLKFIYSQIEISEGKTALDDATINDILDNFRSNNSEVKPQIKKKKEILLIPQIQKKIKGGVL